MNLERCSIIINDCDMSPEELKLYICRNSVLLDLESHITITSGYYPKEIVIHSKSLGALDACRMVLKI
jgi:hypothetical protein